MNNYKYDFKTRTLHASEESYKTSLIDVFEKYKSGDIDPTKEIVSFTSDMTPDTILHLFESLITKVEFKYIKEPIDKKILSLLSSIDLIETAESELDNFLKSSVSTIKMRKDRDLVDARFEEFNRLVKEGYVPVKREYKNYPLVIDSVSKTYNVLFTCMEEETKNYEKLGFTIFRFK